MLTDISLNVLIMVGAVALYGAGCVMLGAFIGLLYMRQTFRYGSTEGSRAKDVLIGKVLTTPPPAPIILPQPPAPQKPPAPPGLPSPPRQTGITATRFGGTDDRQSSAYSDVPSDWGDRPGCALPYHFPGKRPNVRVFGPNGKSMVLPIVDVGPWFPSKLGPADQYWLTRNARPRAETDPHCRNPAGIDLTDAADAYLGTNGEGKVDWEFAVGEAPTMPASQVTNQPPWLTLARAEIGFHELPGNHGIQKYVDLAGYGADGEPWCAIFAGAMFRKAGVPIPGVNAMARSFSTSPAFTKLDGFRKGAVAVFWRGSPSSDTGHVGFADAETATHVQTIGGNENDAVMIEAVPKAGNSMGLLGYWWPAQLSTSTAAEPNLA